MIKAEKTKTIEEVKGMLDGVEGFVLADFQGMTVAEMTDVKKKIRETGASAKVIKNNLIQKALDAAQIAGVEPYLKGNTFFVWTKSDIAATLKTVAAYAKENEKFKLKGGYVTGQVCDSKAIVELSKLPGRLELISMIAGGVNAVIGQFVGVLNAVMSKFVGTIEALEKKQKEN